MKKRLLPDHFISKELGLEVFDHPEEISNFIYVRTSNGKLHRFHNVHLNEDKERALERIKHLNSFTYDLLFQNLMYLMKRNEDLIREYMAGQGEVSEETILDITTYMKDLRTIYS